LFAGLDGPEPGVPGGMKVDTADQPVRRRRRHFDHRSEQQARDRVMPGDSSMTNIAF
jgi:hypothetical protein